MRRNSSKRAETSNDRNPETRLNWLVISEFDSTNRFVALKSSSTRLLRSSGIHVFMYTLDYDVVWNLKIFVRHARVVYSFSRI